MYVFLGGFKKPPAGFLTTSSDRGIDWNGFRRYVCAEHSWRHAKDLMLYARKYGECLLRGDLSPLLQLSPNKRRHALMGISALSKYLGIHDEFKRLREKYCIKWAVNDAVPRMLLSRDGFTAMLKKARETIKILNPRREVVLFLALSGLRIEEALNSLRIFHERGAENYLNKEIGVLEHYRFPEVFIRRTKHAYITVVDDYMLKLLENTKPVSYDTLRNCFRRRSQSTPGFYLFRKIWATYMHQKGIPPETIDLLQGRTPSSVFTRHYLRWDFKEEAERVRKELPSLAAALNEKS